MANRLKEEERMNGSYAAFLSCPTTADGLIAVVWIHSMFAPTSGCLCAPHAVEYRSYRPSRGRKPGEWLLFGGASASQAWNAPVAPNSLAPQGRVPSQSITNSTDLFTATHPSFPDLMIGWQAGIPYSVGFLDGIPTRSFAYNAASCWWTTSFQHGDPCNIMGIKDILKLCPSVMRMLPLAPLAPTLW
ncbi:hypothetical protein MLD38_015012 [Melastoma candidum]|uniref:Uncharacterized protein n=1 Tax=Melastoma candidum TaxID=119954 RepID=A0ACB9RID5_9MYRT|nr:hypothetical protein MLD38_015012 [Melastoma candidum]